MDLNLGLREELRLYGSGILESLTLFGLNHDVDCLNHLYNSLLIAKVIDVKCNIHWMQYTRFIASKYEFVNIFGKRKLKEDEVALYHHGNGVYSREAKDYLAMIVWKKKSISKR